MPLAGNGIFSTFAPAFREGAGSLERTGREGEGEDEVKEQRPFEKIVKKVLGGNGKGITFAVRFREEKR